MTTISSHQSCSLQRERKAVFHIKMRQFTAPAYGDLQSYELQVSDSLASRKPPRHEHIMDSSRQHIVKKDRSAVGWERAARKVISVVHGKHRENFHSNSPRRVDPLGTGDRQIVSNETRHHISTEENARIKRVLANTGGAEGQDCPRARGSAYWSYASLLPVWAF
jgi:hypothetical protein